MVEEMVPFTSRITSPNYKLPYLKSTLVDNMMAIWEIIMKKDGTDYTNICKWLNYLSTQSVNPRRREIRKQYMWYLRIMLETGAQCLPFTEPVPQRLPELFIYLENNNIAKTQYIELIKFLNEDKDALKPNKSFSVLNKGYQLDVESGAFESLNDPSFLNDLVINDRLEMGRRVNYPCKQSERCNEAQHNFLNNLNEKEKNEMIANTLNLRKDLLKEKDLLSATKNENIQDTLEETILSVEENKHSGENSKIKQPSTSKKFKFAKHTKINILMSNEETVDQNRNTNDKQFKNYKNSMSKQFSNTPRNTKSDISETLQVFSTKEKQLYNDYIINEPINLNDLLNKYDIRQKVPSVSRSPMKVKMPKKSIQRLGIEN
uniref:DUF4485 domain-containing protein n=1 Tax=Rhodnius prolixus TaxID=13249 RepID=T1I2A7_RHOPR